jgi:hypothetical protein
MFTPPRSVNFGYARTPNQPTNNLGRLAGYNSFYSNGLCEMVALLSMVRISSTAYLCYRYTS